MDLKFRVSGLRLEVWGLGCGVWVEVVGYGVLGLGLGLGVWGLEFDV